MKKLLALVMALAMLLSCTAALAEASATPALTLYSELDIDRDVLAADLAAFGLDEDTAELVDVFAAVLTEAAERLVFVNNGLQYDLILKDKDVLTIAGELTDAGLSIGSSVIPSYVINISEEEVTSFLEQFASMLDSDDGDSNLDVNALVEAASAYVEPFVESFMSAITYGEPTTGEYEVNGNSYNTTLPIDVDMAAIIEAVNKLEADLEADPTIGAVLEQAKTAGVSVTPAEEQLDPATAPALHLDMYLNIDESGAQTGPSETTFTVTPSGEEQPATTGNVLVDGSNVTVKVNALTADTTVVFASANEDGITKVSLDVTASGVYFGCVANAGTDEDALFLDADLYVLDADKPLLSTRSTLTFEGERTLTLGEGKTAVTLADLTGEDSESTVSGLAMDAMFNGLGGIISAATEAMPDEINALMSVFQGAEDAA